MLLRRIALLLALALMAGTTTGCLTRPIKKMVYDDRGTQAFLRSYKRVTSVVPQNYQHPITIAPVRMAHILSRIDIRRQEDGERVPAIPLSLLYRISDAMVEALEAAGPDQEVVILAQERKKQLFLFDHNFLTSLMAYQRDDLLYIHIAYADYELSKRRGRDAGIPEAHVGEFPRKFRLIIDRGMTLNDHQSVAVEWRDDIFRKPTRTRITSTGKVVRRQVLMESFEDESIAPVTPQISTDLTPEQLRSLADLEEERQNGNVSETQYQSRRGRILRGEPVTP